MRTTKPISTISFNTQAYLTLKLNELLKAGKLSFWAIIPHKGEDDEAGKKPHFHLYAEPAKLLQTDDITAELKEYDPTHPSKPLSCLTWKSSNFDNWYMYGLHDKRYLASKGQSRKFHYTHNDFISSDADDLLCKARSIDLTSLSPYADMLDAQRQGLNFAEYFARGTIPIPQLRAFEAAWNMLIAANTSRADREPHPTIDPDTGEYFDPKGDD